MKKRTIAEKSGQFIFSLYGMTDISYVLNTGKILQYTLSVCHYRRRNNSYRRVFRTADGNLSGQSLSAPYN